MRNGQELVIQLALLKKPAAFGLDGDSNVAETVTNALNAVRLFGHSQILVSGGADPGWRWQKNNPSYCYDEDFLAKICEMILAMQVKGEKVEITTTPATPEERAKAGFCRVDLHLER